MNKNILKIIFSSFLICFCFHLTASKTSAEITESDLFFNDTVQDIMISVSWENKDVNFTFIDPSGVAIDPNKVTPAVSNIASEKGIMVIISDAAMGQWKWKYDKGSNEYLEVSVSDYKEPVWIQSFQTKGVNGNTLLFQFDTMSEEAIYYNYTINIKTALDAAVSKEISYGSGISNTPMEGTIDLRNINTYDNYILELKVSYTDNNLEYFDIAYSEAFSYTNPNQIAGIEDFNLSINDTTGTASVNSIIMSSEYYDEIIARFYADDQILLERSFTMNDISECMATYTEEAKELKVGLTLVTDGILAKEYVKACTIQPEDNEFKLELPEDKVTNQKMVPIKYFNATGQEVTITLNEMEDSWLLDGNGEKLIELTESNSKITLAYTDNNNITRRYDRSIAIDLYPPLLNIIDNLDGMVTSQELLVITGETEAAAIVTINGTAVEVKEAGTFLYSLPLIRGENNIAVLAKDLTGNETAYYAKVNRTQVSDYRKLWKEYFPLVISLLASFIGILLIVFLPKLGKKKIKPVADNKNGKAGTDQ